MEQTYTKYPLVLWLGNDEDGTFMSDLANVDDVVLQASLEKGYLADSWK